MIACVLLRAGCGGGGGGNNAAAPPPPAGDPQFRVSGTSPFAAGCDGVPAFGTLYVNAEVEPMVALNPRNANNIVGVWQQDRWSTGGAEGLLTAVSLDGGRTWSQHMAAFSHCTGGNAANGGDYSRASDPWVTFAPDGTVYQSSLSFNGARSRRIVERDSVSRSTDGGATWSNPITVISYGQNFSTTRIRSPPIRPTRVCYTRCGTDWTTPDAARPISAAPPMVASPGKSRARSTIQARTARQSTIRSWSFRMEP
jgi:hypothetical protein